MCFAFVLFLPLSLIPVGGHYINETEVSFAEFWRRGGGPIFFVAGILFPVTGYGFVRAQNWSRFVFTALHFGVALTTVFYGSISFDTALAFAWVGFVAYYLFWRPNVRDYFTRLDHAGI
jgi:hypothetical protein